MQMYSAIVTSALLVLLQHSNVALAQYGYNNAASRLDTIKQAIINRNPKDMERYGVNIQLIARAQNILDEGIIIRPDERMDIPWAGVSDVPLIWPAYQFYLQHGLKTGAAANQVRHFFLSCVDAGMSADVDYLGEGLIENSWIKLPLSDCLNSREDVEVCLALMRAGHPVDPVVGNWNAINQYNQQYVQGVSFFNLIAVGASGVPIMRVFYRMDREVQRGAKTAELALDENLVDKYINYTPSFQPLRDQLLRHEPLNDRLMSNNRLKELDVEIESAELEGLFNFTEIDMREIEICAPWNDYNALHFCAIMQKPRFVNIFQRNFEALEHGSSYRDQVASSCKKALALKSQFAGRNPLHIGSLRHGQDSDTFKSLLALEIACHGDDSRINNMQDDYGMSPYDYDGGMDAVNEATLNGYHMGDQLFPDRPVVTDDYNGFSYNTEDAGGWGVSKHDDAFATAAGVNLRGRSRCDIVEVEGMPTPDEVGLWLERNEPVMFRNAIRNWTIRDSWTKHNFLKKYGNRQVSTSKIPYAESFDTVGSGTRTMTLGDYVNSWGNSDEQYSDEDVPRYMFSGQFSSENPDIDDDMPEFLGLLDDLPYPTKVMAKQLFVGPALSGAPIHWHNTAMNAIAYGRKHWFLVPPNQTFYSVWPTKNMVKNELDVLRDEGYSVLQCAQNAGDLLLVGQSWGHATLNQHPTLGMAIEFTYRVLSTEMQLPTFQEEMSTPEGQQRVQNSGQGQGQGHPQNLFAQLDTDNNGRISKSEFSALGTSIPKRELKNLFQNDDTNQDGFISWHEFTGPKGNSPGVQGDHHSRSSSRQSRTQQQDSHGRNGISSNTRISAKRSIDGGDSSPAYKQSWSSRGRQRQDL